MAALSVLGAQWRLKSEDRAFLMTELVPWSLQAGTRCADLMCLDYEDHFKVGLLSAASSLPFAVLIVLENHGAYEAIVCSLKVVNLLQISDAARFLIPLPCRCDSKDGSLWGKAGAVKTAKANFHNAVTNIFASKHYPLLRELYSFAWMCASKTNSIHACLQDDLVELRRQWRITPAPKSRRSTV